MNCFYTYMITDTNRRVLQPGVTTNLAAILGQLNPIQEESPFSQTDLNRIVFIEKFSSILEAKKRVLELSGYGRMVRERLIRKNNPNWLNLFPNVAAVAHSTKRVAVYA